MSPARQTTMWLSGEYSKTSNNGPSEKRTTSLQRTAHLPMIDFTIELIHFEPPRSGHLSTPNNGHWSGPDVSWPIQNHLRKRTVKLHPHNDRWIQWPSTILALCYSLSRQCKATERSENASPADHTLPRLPEVYRMPITDTSVFRIRSAVVLATVLANEIFCYTVGMG